MSLTRIGPWHGGLAMHIFHGPMPFEVCMEQIVNVVLGLQEMDELSHPLLGEEPTLQLLPDPSAVAGAYSYQGKKSGVSCCTHIDMGVNVY